MPSDSFPPRRPAFRDPQWLLQTGRRTKKTPDQPSPKAALEAKLHERFAAGRLNKVNGRKGFFWADIREIEAVIMQNYDSVVEVTHEAGAEQFHESLRTALPKVEIMQVEAGAAAES